MLDNLKSKMEELNNIHVKNFNSDLFNYEPKSMNVKTIGEEIKEADFYLMVKRGEDIKENGGKNKELFDYEKELMRNIRREYKKYFKESSK